MIVNRRGLITGLVSLIAAPAIVRASSLMPVRCPPLQGRFPPLAFNPLPCDLRPGAVNWVREWEDCARYIFPGLASAVGELR